MKAILKHELSSYFTGMMGYVFGAFLLFFAGMYAMVYNIKEAITNFEYVIGGMSFVFLVIVPILTMRVLAEEKKQKTDQLLYSLPISMTKIILGKYFAMLIMLLIPLAIVSLYPIIFSAFGNIYFPASYSAIISFFFLGAALIAIGMFISSLTESQAVAAGICFVIMLLNYFLANLAEYVSTSAFSTFVAFSVMAILVAFIFKLMTKSGFGALTLGIVLEVIVVVLYIFKKSSFEGMFADMFNKLSLFERFYNIVDGVFDITTIIYFISVIVLFVFLSVQSMEKRRWSE